MALEWQETADGFAAAGFRIRRLNGSGVRWQLDAAPHRSSPHATDGIATSFHERLADARRRAERIEHQRCRRALIRGHVGVGVGAAFVFAVSASTMTGIPLFVLTVVAGYVALRSFVSAIGHAVGDAWNWTRDHGVARPLGWWDRILQRSMMTLEGPAEWPRQPDHEEAAVKVVRPFDERHPFSRRPGR